MFGWEKRNGIYRYGAVGCLLYLRSLKRETKDFHLRVLARAATVIIIIQKKHIVKIIILA